MATFDTWESYFYPPPDSATLRNLEDIRDARVLAVFEYGATALRQRQLNADPSLIAHTFDDAHLRAIHRHLFQDVYEWAGEHRTVNISKGAGRGFGDVQTGEVDRLLADVHRLAVGTDWSRLDRDDFGSSAAEVFAYLNQAHVFREGNGRASKVFMEQVAERSRFTLDFTRVGPVEWNQASQLSRPDLFDYAPQAASLVPVFQAIAQPRTNGPAGQLATDAGRSALRASYPQSPTQATHQPAPGPQARHAGEYPAGRSHETNRGVEGR